MQRAYTISDVVVKGEEAANNYRERAAASIAKFGGSYVVRGGTIEVVEGDWTPSIIVIAEFPDMETARRWYRSPEYAEALKFRDEALSRNLIFVEGVEKSE